MNLDRPVILHASLPSCVGGAKHLASLRDALAEQSALGSLVSKLTDSLKLDYVASGSNRYELRRSLREYKSKREITARAISNI